MARPAPLVIRVEPKVPARIEKDENELDITDLDPNLVLIDPKRPKEERRKRRHVGWSGALIGLVCAIGGLALGRAGHIWPVFDVFAQFGMQFVLMAASFSLAVALPRLKSTFGLLFFVLSLIGYGLWPLIVSDQPVSQEFNLPAGERPLKVAHFNMFYVNDDLDGLTQEIERLDADIMTLIEFSPNKRPILDRLRIAYPYQFSCDQEPECHLAIISKYPISSPEAKGRWEGPPYIQARFATLGGLTVLGVHTTRFPHSRAQLRQVTALVQNLQTERGSVIMMGDFNATPFSRVVSTIEGGAGLVRQTSLPTWPTGYVLPQLAIDHIFTSQNIRPLTPEVVGNPTNSDHFPIAMTLAIPDK